MSASSETRSGSARKGACDGIFRIPAALALALAFCLAASGLARAQSTVPPAPTAPLPVETLRRADPGAQANRAFVSAMQRIRDADATYDPAEEIRLLKDAENLLDSIIREMPESPLAVQLISNQFIGDFDFFSFRNRVRSLACGERTGAACFLERIGVLLTPLETPITTARWDWLALAVAYHHLGDPARARELIAPFLSAVRRGAVAEDAEPDLFVSRALGLTGAIPLALEVTRQIPDCANRIYNLTDLAEMAGWQGDAPLAGKLAEEAREWAASHNCTWENGLVVQALQRIGRDDEARALFKRSMEPWQSRGRDARKTCCPPPELVVAAAAIGEPNQALTLLRDVQEDNSWTVAAVLGRLARRGEHALALAYAEQSKDPEVRAEAYAELIDAALKRNDRTNADDITRRLLAMSDDAGSRRVGVLAQRARIERLLHPDDRWRATYLRAIIMAERNNGASRRDTAVPLLNVLVRIETGHPLLD